MKKFICGKVAGFQVAALLKVNFFTFTFQDLPAVILMAASTISFFNLFLLSFKQLRRTVGLLQNVLPKISKLFVRHYLDYAGMIHHQTYTSLFIRN